jgi:hypothetical protein
LTFKNQDDDDKSINVPAELGFLYESQRKLNENNKQLWNVINKRPDPAHGLRRLPQFKGSQDEDFMIWFEDFKLTIQRTCSIENERLSIFKTYLAGDARLVYEGFNADHIDSLDQAGEMMKQVFAIAREQQEWILHLRDMKKKDTKNFRVFAYRTT